MLARRGITDRFHIDVKAVYQDPWPTNSLKVEEVDAIVHRSYFASEVKVTLVEFGTSPRRNGCPIRANSDRSPSVNFSSLQLHKYGLDSIDSGFQATERLGIQSQYAVKVLSGL